MAALLLGIDPEAVAADFEGAIAGRTLIMDGDGPAYRAAATSKRLDTAIRRYHTDMLTQMFLTNSQFITVHLTCSKSLKNHRGSVIAAKPYQGNRVSKSKPPLLEPLRTALENPEHWLPNMNTILHRIIEADDGMIQQAYQLKGDGVIWSDDKDLMLTPYLYYRQKLGIVEGFEPVGFLQKEFTPAGMMKVTGRSVMFFWCQMLMGDTADNVKGILELNGRLCGPAAAFDALQHCKTEADAANFVVDAYRKINQNVLAEAWCLWLLRWDGDTAYKYLLNCGLDSTNLAFVQDCAQRAWFVKPSKAEKEHYD